MKRQALCLLIAVVSTAAADDLPLADVALQQGLDLARAQRWDEARRALLLGQSQAPRDKRFPSELAGIEYKSGHAEQAKKELHRVLRLDPSDAYANDALGSIYLLEGNLLAALPYWNRIGQPKIRQVSFDPPGAGDDAAAARAIEIRPGEVLLASQVTRSLANLDRMGEPAGKLDLIPASDGFYDVSVKLSPTGLTAANLAGTAIEAASALPYETVNLHFRPAAGALETIGATGRWDPNKRLAALSLSGVIGGNPHFVYRAYGEGRDEDWQILQGSSVAHGSLPFRYTRAMGAFEIDQSLSDRLRWINGVSFANVHNSDPLLTAGQELKARTNLAYEIRWPEQRVTTQFFGEGDFGRTLNLNAGFAQAQAGVASRWAIARTLELEASVRGGRSFGTVPFDSLFMLGMERDNDLWLRGHVGTHDGRKGNAPIGGDYVLTRSDLMKTLYRHPLFNWQLGPFLDSGSAGGFYGSNGWLVDAGLQTRIQILHTVSLTVVAGNDLRHGGTVVYSAVNVR